VRRTLLSLLSAACLVAGTTVAVSPASAKPRPANPKGHYVGTEVPEEANGLDDVIFEFDVRQQGRRITDFTIAMNVVCAGYPVYVEYVVQPMDDMRVNPRTGRFRDVVAGTTDGGTEYRVEVTGQLKGTQVKRGTMSYDVGICQRGNGDAGPVRWKAKRVSKKYA
jgi:hypothetical protein